MSATACLLYTTLLCTMASGQWIRYPTAGVPRGKDGKPNLSAPAPRGSDNKPDLSGMWITAEGLPCPKSLTDDTGDCLEKSPLSRFAADLNPEHLAIFNDDAVVKRFEPGEKKSAGPIRDN